MYVEVTKTLTAFVINKRKTPVPTDHPLGIEFLKFSKLNIKNKIPGITLKKGN